MIAMFADIHANRPAFEACLRDAARRGAGEIVLLGDYVGYGADPAWTVDTVAGLVFSELGYIPTPGETLTAHGATFTVLAAEERKITRLHVEAPGREAEDGD